MTPDPRRARLESLLATEATQGLAPAETAELDALLAAFPDEDPDGFERAAAAVHLALSVPEEMPSRLVEKLHLAAVAFTPASATPRPARTGRPAWATWAGWAVAASLAAVLVYTNLPKKPEQVRPDTTARVYDASQAGVSASVSWSNTSQKGEFEVRGLPPNDPAKEQYQLWIVDAAQKQPVPVDGGVFDVKPDGTTTFAVRSPIRVSDAQAFAISKEKPGGGPQPAGPIVLVLKPKPS